jgi:ankyrin repeat protein
VRRLALVLVLAACPQPREPHAGDTALITFARADSMTWVDGLLARGADPNQANAAGATALHYAVGDVAMVKSLLDHGARPDPLASEISPLMIAALRDDGDAVVKLLLAHGANPARAVELAAGNPTSLRLLVDAGAPINTKRGEFSPLHGAALRGSLDSATLLVEHGAVVDARDAMGRTPLMWAAQMGRGDVVQLLLAHGADPNVVETFSNTTALMQAAASDRGDLAIVEALLAAGADTSPVDEEGATALAWAIRRGAQPIVDAIAARTTNHKNPVSRRAGTPVGPTNTAARAIARSLPLLEHAGPNWRHDAGCPSCHHDAFPAVAIARAAARGIDIDVTAQRAEARGIASSLRPLRDRIDLGIGFADVVEPAYFLFALDASGYPPDDITEAMARYLAIRQTASGAWRTQMQRLPMDGSDIAYTALAARGLAVYAAPSTAPIARAREFLAHADATSNEDLVFRALGLRWTGAPAADVAAAIAALRTTQHADGGFAQGGTLASDAYATAQAIVAMREAGDVPASDPQIRRAVRFLLDQQVTDGSWFVATRALPFQPWFDSGVPQGRSQYISIAATAWAVWALAIAADA